MFRSSGSDKYESKPKQIKQCCCLQEYEEQISILQQKLMQTHSKLIQQLDVCRQQELTIIDLTKKLMHFQENSIVGSISESGTFVQSQNNADISKQSNQINRLCFYPKQNIQFTLNNSNQLLMSNYNSPTFLENNRNELLKTDLQAMRMKLLEQITEKTNLREELNELKMIHIQKVTQYKKQVADLENDHQFLLKQYQYIKVNLQRGSLKKDSYSSAQITELNEKCLQYERLYKKEINLNQQLNQHTVQMKKIVSGQRQKIKTLQTEAERYNNCVKSTSTAADGLKEQRDREQMCGTIRMGKSPGMLSIKDTNKGKVSSSNLTDTQVFKKRNTVVQVNYVKQRAHQSIRSIKQNIAQSTSKPHHNLQTQTKKSHTNKDEYQSTKQLIKKLQQAQMITRQRKKLVTG